MRHPKGFVTHRLSRNIVSGLLCALLTFTWVTNVAQAATGEVVTPSLDQTALPVLLKEPVSLERVELSSEALAVWRQSSTYKPTLLLLSQDPMLETPPAALTDDILAFASTSSGQQLLESSSYRSSSPLLLPTMTVDVALRSGWFGKLAWALPSREPDLVLNAESFRQQLQGNMLISEQEGESLEVIDKLVVAGVLRNTPMVAAALPNLPVLAEPVVVHIDQSYFSNIYKNEIATPIFPLIINTLKELRRRNLSVLAATFCYGNLTGRIALDVRFAGDVIAQYIEHPDHIGQPVPSAWKRQADILYLNNFFKKEQTRELAVAMNADAPDSAWVKYSLYKTAVENNLGNQALDALAEAVKLDKIYALEYLSLAKTALDRGRPDESMRMLFMAAEVFPADVQIKLNIISLASAFGDNESALRSIDQLQQLKWSAIYYPGMPGYLNGLKASLAAGEAPSETPTYDSDQHLMPSTKPIEDPRRRRILK